METQLLQKETNTRTCATCGSSLPNEQSACIACSDSTSSPVFLAGIITAFIGVIAFYLIFQI